MRGPLSEERLQEIDSRLPAVDSRLWLATSQGFGVDISDLLNEKNLGVALVCLQDAGRRFSQVRLALHETLACLIWYREEAPKAPVETSAVFLGKFYVDYATLLLYATGEDIAAFIIAFLGIEAKLKDYLDLPDVQKELTRKKISSNAGKVGIYLRDEKPDHEITKITLDLHKNPNWQQALK